MKPAAPCNSCACPASSFSPARPPASPPASWPPKGSTTTATSAAPSSPRPTTSTTCAPSWTAPPWRHENPQDWLYGGACHPIDLLRWFFGDVEEVFTYASHSHIDDRYPADKQDNFLINLRFESGVIARILAVFGLVEPPLPQLGLGVFGDKGSFVNGQLVLDKFEGQPVLSLDYRREPGHGLEVMRYMRHFEECILEDKRPLVDEVAGAKVIATAAACWDSIRTGMPAKVQPVE